MTSVSTSLSICMIDWRLNFLAVAQLTIEQWQYSVFEICLDHMRRPCEVLRSFDSLQTISFLLLIFYAFFRVPCLYITATLSDLWFTTFIDNRKTDSPSYLYNSSDPNADHDVITHCSMSKPCCLSWIDISGWYVKRFVNIMRLIHCNEFKTENTYWCVSLHHTYAVDTHSCL